MGQAGRHANVWTTGSGGEVQRDAVGGGNGQERVEALCAGLRGEAAAGGDAAEELGEGGEGRGGLASVGGGVGRATAVGCRGTQSSRGQRPGLRAQV